MSGRQCILCRESKSIANYIGVQSKILNGTMPICRSCIANLLSQAGENKWNVANKLCQLADIPFIPEEFEKAYKAYGINCFGNYCYIFRDKPYNTLDWTEYNQAYLQLQDEEELDEAVPAVKEKRQKELIRKWGSGYDEEQLEYLENLHIGILNSAGVVGALNEDQVLKLCKISLIIEEKIRAGLDFTKDLKGYDDLCKLAGVSSQTIKDGSEFNSTGEVWAYLERLGYKAKYYDGAVNDEVDKTIKDIQYWTRYLYINETGVAEEINERIENLKVADKLTGENFDWGEYENYADSVDDEEEFDIEI